MKPENRSTPWKCRAVENEKNQNPVSLVSPRPWKSLRDFHIPTAPAIARSLIPPKNNPERSFGTAPA